MTPCCAHIQIDHRTEETAYQGEPIPRGDDAPPLMPGTMLTTEWWECRDCKTHFEPTLRVAYGQQVLAKIWEILADGERQLNPDADPEYDTNNMYDLIQAGVKARVELAAERERCALIVAEFSPVIEDLQPDEGTAAIGIVNWEETAERLVAAIRDGHPPFGQRLCKCGKAFVPDSMPGLICKKCYDALPLPATPAPGASL